MSDEPTIQPDDEPEHTGRVRDGKGRWIQTPEELERVAEALRLRGRGWTYPRIAEHLGVDRGNLYRAMQAARKEILREPAESARDMELERLDLALTAVMDVLDRKHITFSNGQILVHEGHTLEDDGPVLAAVDRLVRISESRRKLLGLDSAQKIDVTGGVKYEIVGVDPAALT